MTHTAENKAKALRLWDQVLNKRNWAVIAEIDSPNYKFNGDPQTFAQIQAFVEWINSQAPGYEFVVNYAVAEGETVALRWQLNIPAGNKVSGTNGHAAHVIGANFLTFKDGLIITNDQAGGLADLTVNA